MVDCGFASALVNAVTDIHFCRTGLAVEVQPQIFVPVQL